MNRRKAGPESHLGHGLSEEEHRLHREEHKQWYVESTQASQQPTVIIIAGQPGAGKTALTEQALKAFPPNERPVVVDVDKLRESHPGYAALRRKNNRTAASLVQADAGAWSDELAADARDARRNVIIDGTLKSPDKAEALCRHFKNDGYRVEVRAMAVRWEDSELGVYERYEHAKAAGRYGRWVPNDARYAAYSGLPESLKRLNGSDCVDSIAVYRRSLDGARQPTLLSESAPGQSDPAAVLEAERSRERTEQELAWFDSEMQQVMEQIEARDPNLLEPENRMFVERTLRQQRGQLQSHSPGKAASKVADLDGRNVPARQEAPSVAQYPERTSVDGPRRAAKELRSSQQPQLGSAMEKNPPVSMRERWSSAESMAADREVEKD